MPPYTGTPCIVVWTLNASSPNPAARDYNRLLSFAYITLVANGKALKRPVSPPHPLRVPCYIQCYPAFCKTLPPAPLLRYPMLPSCWQRFAPRLSRSRGVALPRSARVCVGLYTCHPTYSVFSRGLCTFHDSTSHEPWNVAAILLLDTCLVISGNTLVPCR